MAGRELPANVATLVSNFAGDWQHHRQGKIRGPGHCQPGAPLDLTTYLVPPCRKERLLRGYESR